MRLLKSVLLLIITLTVSPVMAGEVLIIESNHSTDRWDSGYLKALNKVMGRRHSISYFEINAKRTPEEAHKERAEAAWKKYQELKPDFVVLGDDVAIDYLGQRFAKESVPVVFLGANKNPRTKFHNRKYPPNITGVLERPLIKKSVSELSRMLPQAKRMLILFDNSEVSKHAIDQNGKTRLYISGVSVVIKHIATLEEWKQTIKNTKKAGFDAVIIGHHDAIKAQNGVIIPAEAILTWTSQTIEVPLFAFWDKDVGIGKAAGGLLVDGYEQGRAAARLLMQVSSGYVPYSIMCWQGRLAFSQTELKRWNISIPVAMHSKVRLFE